MREAGWRTGWDCENTLWRVFVLGQKPSDRLVALGAQNAFGVLSNMGSFTAPYHPPTNEPPMGAHLLVADRVGFEPTRRFPVHTLSKRAPSATRPPVLTKRRDYSVSLFSGKRGVRHPASRIRASQDWRARRPRARPHRCGISTSILGCVPFFSRKIR